MDRIPLDKMLGKTARLDKHQSDLGQGEQNASVDKSLEKWLMPIL